MRRPNPLDAFRDRIGVLPDAEIARITGYTTSGVTRYRLRRGIANSRGAQPSDPALLDRLEAVVIDLGPIRATEAAIAVVGDTDPKRVQTARCGLVALTNLGRISRLSRGLYDKVAA